MANIKSFIVLASFAILATQDARAMNPTIGSAGGVNNDESPLESLISTEAQAKIDARKAGGMVQTLDTFNGSRSVDLRSRDTAVKQQFSAAKCAGLFHTKVGTCSAFGLTAALENALGGSVNLSERQLWSQYCIPSSEAALKAMTTGKGQVEENYWPQADVSAPYDYSRATRYKVLEVHALEDNLVAMLEALDRGSPLYFAINTPSEMYARKAYTSAGSGNTGGGHALAIVGYKLDETVEGGGWLLIKNSWGPANGENGYNWLAMGYCKRQGNYCSAWSIDRAGLAPAVQ